MATEARRNQGGGAGAVGRRIVSHDSVKSCQSGVIAAPCLCDKPGLGSSTSTASARIERRLKA